jgi:hypothetical protein
MEGGVVQGRGKEETTKQKRLSELNGHYQGSQMVRVVEVMHTSTSC